jgi:phospholipid/cholesterol/gamma-HCH transport system substrate-binding protein
MAKHLRQHSRALGVLLAFAAVSTVAAGYILLHQRVPNPLQRRYEIRVALPSANAVAPGFGQPVTVSGVPVGSITDVRLVAGQAVVTASIRAHDLPAVRADATAVLAPRTPLKDMELELSPGRPPARPLGDGGLIPVSRTRSPIDSDDLNAALDGDTRDYLQTLIAGAGAGLKDRGGDLRAAFAALRPPVRQIRRISTAVAGRRRDLEDLVHSLATLSTAVAREDPALERTLQASSATLRATASESRALGTSLHRLPLTLADIRTALGSVRRLSGALGPAADALTTPARRLRPALTALDPVLDQTTTLLRDRIRPLVPRAQRFVDLLRPSVARLTPLTPYLTSAFTVLDYLGNELAYDPGAQRPYLFWAAWGLHNVNSFMSNGDANGTFVRGFTITGCHTVASNANVAPVVAALTSVIAQACPR